MLRRQAAKSWEGETEHLASRAAPAGQRKGECPSHCRPRATKGALSRPPLHGCRGSPRSPPARISISLISTQPAAHLPGAPRDLHSEADRATWERPLSTGLDGGQLGQLRVEKIRPLLRAGRPPAQRRELCAWLTGNRSPRALARLLFRPRVAALLSAPELDLLPLKMAAKTPLTRTRRALELAAPRLHFAPARRGAFPLDAASRRVQSPPMGGRTPLALICIGAIIYIHTHADILSRRVVIEAYGHVLRLQLLRAGALRNSIAQCT